MTISFSSESIASVAARITSESGVSLASGLENTFHLEIEVHGHRTQTGAISTSICIIIDKQIEHDTFLCTKSLFIDTAHSTQHFTSLSSVSQATVIESFKSMLPTSTGQPHISSESAQVDDGRKRSLSIILPTLLVGLPVACAVIWLLCYKSRLWAWGTTKIHDKATPYFDLDRRTQGEVRIDDLGNDRQPTRRDHRKDAPILAPLKEEAFGGLSPKVKEENVDDTEPIDQGLIEEQEFNETNPQIQTRRYTALHINTHEPSLFPGYTDLTSSTYQKDGELDMPPGYYE
ncbi:hypothetical protein PNOK_0428500 [Pyrrhoderma noxium]|uniref:Uncharacterized protein n=1 Tax=Pyrrhoderma noxium TaxID=2282107 RepID=A0A286UIB2_9AGAM|nr:hypothetical protein PNOK_0428500 [Pyrrhoderma noxium]